MNPLNTSCKKATYLVSKKEEGKLSWLDSIRLRSHLTICSLCRKFESQTGFIGRMAKHASVNATLSPEAKQRLENAMNHRP
ncbi:MAG: hypothetical protein V4539_04900 [Bacteroidota bacterium]